MEQFIYHRQPISNYRFVITGGAGFIGSHLVEYLLQHGAGEVVALDNLATGSRQNVELFQHHSNYRFIAGDICDREICRQVLQPGDYVLHQAALGSVPRSIADPATTNDVNIGGFLNILTAAKERRVKRLIYASSSSVYGDDPNFPKRETQTGAPLSPYAVTKKAGEMYAQVFAALYGMEIIGLRYFNVFGPRQNPEGAYAAVVPLFIAQMEAGKSPRIDGDGSQTRDFTFVENVIQANMQALFIENPSALNRVYNIACGADYSVRRLFELLKEIIPFAGDAAFGEFRPADIRRSLADISLAQQLLGYRPKIDFPEGLRRTTAYFKSLRVL